MGTTRLDETEWRRYFDRTGEALRGRTVTIQVVASDMGAQFAAEGASLSGISYDPRDHQLDIALDGLDHRVRRPHDLYVDETADGTVTVEATDADGRKHIIQIASPPALTGPH